MKKSLKLFYKINVMSSNNRIQFRMLDIETKEFAILKEYYNQESQQVGIQFEYEFNYSPEDNLVGLLVKFSLDHIENSPFVIVSCLILFEIKLESIKAMLIDETLVIPKSLALHFMLLTVGTVRGILHAKTENSAIGKQKLPEINITESIKEDVILLPEKGS